MPAPGGLKRQLGEKWKFLNGDWKGDCSCPPISPGWRDLRNKDTGVISAPAAAEDPAPPPPPPAVPSPPAKQPRGPGDLTGVASFMSDITASVEDGMGWDGDDMG